MKKSKILLREKVFKLQIPSHFLTLSKKQLLAILNIKQNNFSHLILFCPKTVGRLSEFHFLCVLSRDDFSFLRRIWSILFKIPSRRYIFGNVMINVFSVTIPAQINRK